MKRKTANRKKIFEKTNLKAFFGIVWLSSALIFLAGCSAGEKSDLPALAPKDALVYMETADLGKTLRALTENEIFRANSSEQPDFSAFSGMSAAIVVTGFQTSEKQVTAEQSVLNFKPNFTAIAETRAWSWQVAALVENNLDRFVRRTYGTNVKLERKSVNDTERFVWTAEDGRKTFAVISGTQIFFGNDEESINKCLLAKRGEAESLLKNESFAYEYEQAPGKLAFGFIAPPGIKEIADVFGVSVAIGQTEDAGARNFISGILPEIIKNTAREIVWTAEEKEGKIEDRVFVKIERESAEIFSETISPRAREAKNSESYKFLPTETFSATRYDLQNPQIAFRSLLLVAAKNAGDARSRELIAALSGSMLSNYGIPNAEEFLSAVEGEIVTARLDASGEAKFALARVKNPEKIREIFASEIDFKIAAGEAAGKTGFWQTKDARFAVSFYGDFVLLGDPASVLKSLETLKAKNLQKNSQAKIESNGFLQNDLFRRVRESRAAAVTFENEPEMARKIIGVLGKPKSGNKKINAPVVTETFFNPRGIERRYLSDFGFLGTIVEQFDNS